MKTSIFLRIISLPIGLVSKLWNLTKDGSRDIHNRFRFKKVIIDNDCSIDVHSQIEPDCHIFKGTIINKCKIASFSYIGRNSLIQNAEIGRFCSISKEVNIGLGSHPLDMFSTSQVFYRKSNALKLDIIPKDLGFKEYKPIQIGHDVWIGTRAIILDGVSVGHGAVIAANSVVTKDIPPYAIVGGVPAKIIKYRFSETVIREMLELKWWEWEITKIKDEMPHLFKSINQ